MKIEMGKKYTTRDGRPVRILCVDGPEPWPVAGYIKGHLEPQCWRDSGNHSSRDIYPERDLIEAKPEPVVEWVVLDAEGRVVEFTSEKRWISDVNIWNDSPGGKKPYRLAKRTTEIVE